jgi:hypothetical protein
MFLLWRFCFDGGILAVRIRVFTLETSPLDAIEDLAAHYDTKKKDRASTVLESKSCLKGGVKQLS